MNESVPGFFSGGGDNPKEGQRMNQEENKKITFDSTEIERSIISALLVAPIKFHAASEVICSSDFSVNLCSMIFSVMQNLSNRNLAIDEVTVLTELTEISKSSEIEVSPDDFREIMDSNSTSANLLTYCNELKEISERRKAAGALRKAEEALRKGGNLRDIFRELEAVRPTDPGEYRSYQDNNLIKPLISVLDPKERPEIIPTGFQSLDKAINGGLTEGVYLISAIPGLGKTSFVSQILDCVALNGRSCLMFNYEMATDLLIARSLARLAYRQNHRTKSDAEIPTATEIYFKTLLSEPDKEEPEKKQQREKKLEILSETQERYEEAARNLYYVNCDGAYTADRIERRIARHIAETGQKPVVAIDYLQILPAMNPRQINQTEIVSTNLSELTRISRKFGIPVIVVSATSRENYNGSGSMSAFKSTGTAEYTSSLGAVMFYTALKGETKKVEKLTAAEKEHITFKAVKGRNVADIGELEFTRKGAWFYFEEVRKNNAQPH